MSYWKDLNKLMFPSAESGSSVLLAALDSAIECLVYSQSLGYLWGFDGTHKSTGYSGFGPGKNNPRMEGVRNIGPIPRGLYAVGQSYDSARTGPLSIPLSPVKHDSLGRTDFLIHGDSIKNPGTASTGCIILPRDIREWIISGRIIKKSSPLLRVIG